MFRRPLDRIQTVMMNSDTLMAPSQPNHDSLAVWTERLARHTPHTTAFITEEGSLSWREFQGRVERRAAHFTASGVEPGDVVAAVLENGIVLLELFAASSAIGAAFAPLNTRWSSRELRSVVERLDPTLLFERDPTRAEIRAVRQRRPRGFERDQSPALILHTSGTSGTSRGVVLTDRNLSFNAQQFESVTPLSRDDVAWAVAPFFHAAGLNVITTPLWRIGGTSIIDASFDPARGAALFHLGQATCTFLVPQMWTRLFDELGDEPGTLAWGVVGGAPCPDELFERARRLGVRLFHGYGMTETCPMGTMAPPERASRSCVGRPGPLMELELRDGQVFLHGPNVSPGYWRDAASSEERFVDGWVATGDLGYLDSRGDLHLQGRLSDMIITGGENVFPAEVESVLREYPDLEDVAVFSIPSLQWGEMVVAAYTRTAALEAEVCLRTWALARLGKFKTPRAFIELDELPRLGSGKTDIPRLRDVARQICEEENS